MESTAGSLQAASELLRALGTPHRLAIVLELATGPRCVHELVAALGISQSLASQHLRVLRTSGLVVGVRRGKEMAYSLTDEHVARIARDAHAHGTEHLPRSEAGRWQLRQLHEALPAVSMTKSRKEAPA